MHYGLTPILCVAVLLATSIIDVDFVVKGILGCENIRSYSIIILILALSYICTSLDLTGFFEYIALKVIKRAGSSGRRLLIYLFLLTSFLTLFTSNDVVILTITPIILYMCSSVAMSPIPFLFAQFFAANIAGMMWAEILSNKGCFISFSEFSKQGFKIMPIVAAVACLTVVVMSTVT